MIITVPGNFKGILRWDQNFSVKPSEIVGNFFSQDTWNSYGPVNIRHWNDLPKELRACKTLRSFKIKTVELLMESDKTQHKCSA